MRTAVDDWRDFAQQFISPAAVPSDVADVEKAFYAGFWAALLTFRQVDAFSTQAARAAALNRLHVEVQQLLRERKVF